MTELFPGIRVGLIAGDLGQGGAEKQIAYLARSIQKIGGSVKIASLSRGQYWENRLVEMGYPPIWVGCHQNPLLRLRDIVSAFRPYRPHILQSTHFFTNLYAALGAKWLGAASIGSIRSNVNNSLKDNPIFGPLLLRLPDALVANSETARRDLLKTGLPADQVFVLLNSIDLNDFDRITVDSIPPWATEEATVAMVVARLARVKRLDIFLKALTMARQKEPKLFGVIIGDGPERINLEAMAGEMNLLPDGVLFLGSRADVPALLCHASMLVLTSEYEGFPNALLEAMAAHLPVITVPAGDAGIVVQDGMTGFVVSRTPLAGMDDSLASEIAGRMLQLATSTDLHYQMGEAGRRRVEAVYDLEKFPGQLAAIYQRVTGQIHSEQPVVGN
jgi:glycosyltransferase involved in cell wall biosynthesis